MRARIRPAVVVAAGTLASAWSLTPLFRQTSWVPAAALLAAAVFLSGVLAREWFGARGWVPIVQLGTLGLVAGWVFHVPPPGKAPAAAEDPSTLLFGLPTPATVGVWRDLLLDAAGVLRSNAAPAPTTPGVIFLLAMSIGLLALAADLIGVTLAMPALAGLPILAPYLTAVANSNGALPWPYFVTPAVAWLVLLADADQRVRRRWRGVPVAARRPRADAEGADAEGAGGRSEAVGVGAADGRVEASRWAGALGVGGAALVLALLAAQLLPQMPVRYLAEGLGRGGLGGSGVVGFSTDLDLTSNLRATDQTPVLRYRTDDVSPGPLRVLVAERFAGDRWDHRRPTAQPTQGPRMPATGYEGKVETARHTTTVEQTSLDAPNVAAPYGIFDGSMTDAQWAVDERTGVGVVDRTPSSYRLEYLVPQPTREQLETASPTDPMQLGNDDATLELSAEDARTLREAMRGVVPEDAGPYRAAVAIQDWLRSPVFTYSLEGVPEPASGAAGDRSTLLARFLRDKRGYCTHFATTMVLAARERGIPARMAYGFLPGTRTDSGYEVRQSDAHAWPELFFPEIGWLRFEPTPAQRSGNAPAYAAEYGATAGPSLPTSGATSAATAQPSGATSTTRRDRDRDAGFDVGGQTAPEQETRWWPLPVTMLGIALAMLAMPLLARLTRRRDLARAADAAERAEVEWAYLTSALADLGFTPPASRTLRDQQAFYAHAAVLDRAERSALQAVGDTVERARYAPPGTPLPDVGADAALVRRSAGELRSWRRRARAWLWPGYAVSALRRAAAGDRFPPWAPPQPRRHRGPGTADGPTGAHPTRVSARGEDEQPDPYRPPGRAG